MLDITSPSQRYPLDQSAVAILPAEMSRARPARRFVTVATERPLRSNDWLMIFLFALLVLASLDYAAPDEDDMEDLTAIRNQTACLAIAAVLMLMVAVCRDVDRDTQPFGGRHARSGAADSR